MSEDNFLSRWSRRKRQVAAEPAAAEPRLPGTKGPAPATTTAGLAPATAPVQAVPEGGAQPLPEVPPQGLPASAELPPAPTLEDVAALAPGDEVSRFVAQGVDESVKRAALKKLFADPHYNIMDGLDTYIDDYSIADPIPEAMLRQMNQSKFLGLFDHEDEKTDPAQDATRAALPHDTSTADATAPPPDARGASPAPDEDPDLQLQPDDAAGRPGAEDGAAGEPRTERV